MLVGKDVTRLLMEQYHSRLIPVTGEWGDTVVGLSKSKKSRDAHVAYTHYTNPFIE